jgi:NADPH:quinone reductase-like Zn-dependent oxidoreductase
MRYKGQKMKAIIYEKYGTPDVLHLREVAKPTPNDDQILIKVAAASVNALDWHMLTADIFLVRLGGGGFLKPARPILGADVAGTVEAVGKNITLFKPGDEVYGGIGRGGFAEYALGKEKQLVHKPANLTFEQAAAVPVAGLTALQGLRDVGKIQAGQDVLINGAAGGVGTFAIQVAKNYGAKVTAVCSARNQEQALRLGADQVIDYAKENFTQSGKQYDLIFAVNGYHSLADYKKALKPQGIYVTAGGKTKQIFDSLLFGKWMSEKNGRTLTKVSANISRQDLLTISEMLASGKIVPVIDKTYPLSETAEALRYLGAGHARAKLIIKL